MKILIDILHPAHVHLFKNFIRIMEEKGHKILVTARTKDVAIDLLQKYKIKFVKISSLKKGKFNLLWEFVSRTYRLYKISKRFKPDVLLGDMGPSISLVGKLLGRPSVVIYNNECAGMTNWFVYPLASAVCTPDSYYKKVNGTHFTYPGCHELAYLHPHYFVPDKTVLKDLGLRKGEKFFLVRFVSWQASHDINQKGLDLKMKRAIVHTLEKYGRVVITSENELPKEFEKYRMAVSPDKIHSVMYYSSLYVGEGATMASESAVLGTPAVYVNNLQFGYLYDHQKYGLAFNFKTFKPALAKVRSLVEGGLSDKTFAVRKKKMLSDKIDLTQWMVDFISLRKWNR
ncbi:DUF354 domain-containing protein [Candidatus Woesearchaeota archaeon]|nr:DUF354 domain-containing protein [Candidatus Woesearchaeota archaeon]MBT5397263.1 DUF354 domain-containing protein [Candidatus Woesearchaeota archaeon]MBT5924413.1 DUF354 domain-containing protein [Candidatus Woesearchaeota archaeon]MBT6367191.1 DUF354 domain-containing protein [Candidatus Woesearchaeota archaeon]MBT7762663.1 DUF354 domain-containing protein [Candidatus Woesearchaeota archaeon]